MKYIVMTCIDRFVEEHAFEGAEEACKRYIGEMLDALLYKGWSIERWNEPTDGCKWWSIENGDILIVPEDKREAGISFFDDILAR